MRGVEWEGRVREKGERGGEEGKMRGGEGKGRGR